MEKDFRDLGRDLGEVSNAFVKSVTKLMKDMEIVVKDVMTKASETQPIKENETSLPKPRKFKSRSDSRKYLEILGYKPVVHEEVYVDPENRVLAEIDRDSYNKNYQINFSKVRKSVKLDKY